MAECGRARRPCSCSSCLPSLPSPPRPRRLRPPGPPPPALPPPPTPAAAWPVPATGQADRHDAATGCGSHDPGAVPTPPDQEPSRGHHDHVPPALACCAALHCPMLLADLQPALAALVSS